MSISSSSTAGSTTTPLPITGIDPRVEHAARHELELEHLAVDDERVARVVAALVADAHRRFLGEVVGDPALALVAPLGTDDHCARHEPRLPVKRGHVGEMVLDRRVPRLLTDSASTMAPMACNECQRSWFGIPLRDGVALRCARAGSPSTQAGSTTGSGPAAPQSLDSPLGEIVPGMRVTDTDEDACLTLNVWAPEPRRRSRCASGPRCGSTAGRS